MRAPPSPFFYVGGHHLSKPKKNDIPPEHMTLAWTLLLERTRYEGESLAVSLSRAFRHIEKRFSGDQTEHVQVRSDIEKIRKEFNIG